MVREAPLGKSQGLEKGKVLQCQRERALRETGAAWGEVIGNLLQGCRREG